MSNPIHLLIPAAGKGSRFAGVGIKTPKPLIQIFDIPMLIWVINNFPLEANDRVSILSQKGHDLPNNLAPFIQKMSSNVSYFEIDFWTDGPAHSLEILIENLNEDLPVICANSDQFIFSGLNEFVTEVRLQKSHGQILTMEASGNNWSYVGRDSNGLIDAIEEKIQISSEEIGRAHV